MVNSSRTHAALHYLEAAAVSKNNVGCWNSYVFEDEVRVAVGSVVVAVYREHALDFDSRCVGWHDDDRLLLVFVWVVGVGLA